MFLSISNEKDYFDCHYFWMETLTENGLNLWSIDQKIPEKSISISNDLVQIALAS